jgi:DNA-binding transcriptional LysR family regulator
VNQFEDMQTFVRIVDAGSITKAADQLDIAKSALSRRLAELEKRLGLTLLTRTTRSQKLTSSGQTYYQQCVRLIDDITEVESQIKNQHCALSGRIKIAAPLSFGLSHLAPALSAFNQIHPEIYYDIDFNDRKVDLTAEGFDLAIRIGHLADSSLIARKISYGQSMLTASPEYLAKYGTPKTPDDLNQGHVKLRYNLSSDIWYFKTKAKSKQNKKLSVKVPSVITANNGDFLCQQAIAGRGLLYTPDFICYQALQQGLLVPVLVDCFISETIPAYALYPQTRHLSARVRSLVDFLVEHFGEKPYWQVD